MYRMKKGLAAFIAAFFFLGMGGKAQAVIGIPDDVPSSTLLFPFFKINPNRTNLDQQDSLLVVTNTAGPTNSSQSGVNPNIAVHFTIWNASSVHVYDFSVILTPHDVFSCSLYDLIIGLTGCANESTKIPPAPTGVASSLTTSDGKLLTGYVTADVVYSTTSLFPGQVGYPFVYGNILVGHLYLVNLVAGSSTGFNAVGLESVFPCYGHNALPTSGPFNQSAYGFYRTRCEDEQGAANCGLPQTPDPVVLVCRNPSLPYSDFTERIDGPNGDWAQTFTAGGYQIPGPTNILPDSPLSLILRYFSATSINARSEIWLWKDRTTTPSLNVAVYDNAENVHSVTLSVPAEVNFTLTKDIITPGVTDGWFRIKFPCGQYSSCSYNYDVPPGSVSTARPPIQSVAYSLQFADSLGSGAGIAAGLRWDAAFPAHRQYTDYLNIGE